MSNETTSSSPGDNRPKKRRWIPTFGRRSMVITILVHIAFLFVATVLVVEQFQKKHINFHATEPPGPHTEVEHKVELAKRNSVESAPPDLKRITTTSVATITLPDVPEMPKTDDATPSAMSGIDGAMGMGSGTGNGNGTGGAGSPSSNPFGSFDATPIPQLVGSLFDLKQTVDGKPTSFNLPLYHQALVHFVDENWDPGILNKYYKATKTLHTSCIFIPTIAAADGPRAFGVEAEVQPNMYVIWYKTIATPAQDGTYHFVGLGDDILVVRANHQTVLDASIIPVKADLQSEEKRMPLLDFPYSVKSEMAGMYVGPSLHLKAGEPVEIDILIGEEPGGVSHFFLYCEREESTYEKTSNGQPILPVFKLDSSPIQPTTRPHPPFSTTLEPWQPVKPDDTGLGV